MFIPTMFGNRESRFVVSLKSGEKHIAQDICTRTLNLRNNHVMRAGEGVTPDAIRFDYTVTRWVWRRSHVLFLRSLMREIGVPHRFIRQVTVPRLNDATKGVVFNTNNTPGLMILLVHTLIRDMYETPRRYWIAYGLWRSGMSALEAYNKSGWWTVRAGRSGKLAWFEITGTQSQSMNHMEYILTSESVKSISKLKTYKETECLRTCDKPYRLFDHMKRENANRVPGDDMPSPNSLKKYAHLFM